MSFCETQLDRITPLWERMLSHPFLVQTRDGTIQGLDRASPWWPFVENWAGPEFGAYVAYLQVELDKLARDAGPDRLHRMVEAFETTVRCEVAFWEMAMTGEDWPGIPSPN